MYGREGVRGAEHSRCPVSFLFELCMHAVRDLRGHRARLTRVNFCRATNSLALPTWKGLGFVF